MKYVKISWVLKLFVFSCSNAPTEGSIDNRKFETSNWFCIFHLMHMYTHTVVFLFCLYYWNHNFQVHESKEFVSPFISFTSKINVGYHIYTSIVKYLYRLTICIFLAFKVMMWKENTFHRGKSISCPCLCWIYFSLLVFVDFFLFTEWGWKIIPI